MNGSEKDFQEKLLLNYDENSLTVRFSPFNYRDVAATRYSYMLEGYDKDWSEPSGYSFAQYHRLPPGRYVLHVKVYGSGGPDEEQTLDIVIRHPWWATWWAYLVYFIVVIAVGYDNPPPSPPRRGAALLPLGGGRERGFIRLASSHQHGKGTDRIQVDVLYEHFT